ncbi:hypothetical protein CLIB1423_02S11078 [[Candida] railenensis]|uniref:Hap4 transcription factor heteromerisation domain-containing protein n=1 Tax=[Candida] railenensis TaxID=45579 RepID=A0A9P0VX46_9ASCO|nr:hypothetical protein CLIB1423_02S11078 [[Candida] railenensis]
MKTEDIGTIPLPITPVPGDYQTSPNEQSQPHRLPPQPQQNVNAAANPHQPHPYPLASSQSHAQPRPQPQSQPHPSAHVNPSHNQQKYHKIQPAAIKPKPVPIAMLPKPVHKSYFDPTPNLKSSIQLNVNTSKKWVLPPRPRPGRKPTSGHGDDINGQVSTPTLSQTQTQTQSSVQSPNSGQAPPNAVASASYNSKLSPKKKSKVTMEDESMKIISQLQQQFPNISANTLASVAAVPVAVPSAAGAISSPDATTTIPIQATNQSASTTVTSPPITSNTIKNLKIYYVSKIKEQELVKNYIEVINKQIKELKFVQNGVITFDALNNDEKSQSNPHSNQQNQNQNQNQVQAQNQQPSQLQQQLQQRQISSPQLSSAGVGMTSGLGLSSLGQSGPYEQLERINNINDLNKFLSYLTKSSNIIHSVTKKYNISDENLDSQIKAFLDKKAKTKQQQKLQQQQQQQRAEQAQKSKVSSVGSVGLGRKNGSSPSSMLLKSSLEMNTPLKSIEEDFSDDGIDVFSILKETPTIPSGLEMEELFTINELEDYILIDKGLNREDGQGSVPIQANQGNGHKFQDYSAQDQPGNRDVTPVAGQEQVEQHQHQHQHQQSNQGSDSSKHQPTKRSKKVSSCGFCSNGTPCLCLDADIEIRSLK